jgi:hypothetical protein
MECPKRNIGGSLARFSAGKQPLDFGKNLFALYGSAPKSLTLQVFKYCLIMPLA